ncbi:Sec-independent protein translocase subunit TatA [Corynebacterium guangdongense]|uniref:Sec-independent protein translocase protein TatA n=1 Tax=Corynebacterium guangdongense TaxID=1783348 RepID=A0ABU1ZWU3_9CORY|nr:Sec-independent protein translocase subunit TatA [Corynebacterium guangdongense]MDR7329335.1 sec-independent protein translocase protein TatA [Corynebacterium guangdongense]WJZ17900.1 Sec-independent protein translocase protein TatA [Corynebacterium guangdongense]
MNLGPWEIIAILVVIVLLFGAKKLPDLARSVGRSARIFKSEVKEMKNDDQPQAPAAAQQNDAEFWDSPENQPRQIEQQQPAQDPRLQQPQQPYQQHPNQNNQ